MTSPKYCADCPAQKVAGWRLRSAQAGQTYAEGAGKHTVLGYQP